MLIIYCFILLCCIMFYIYKFLLDTCVFLFWLVWSVVCFCSDVTVLSKFNLLNTVTSLQKQTTFIFYICFSYLSVLLVLVCSVKVAVSVFSKKIIIIIFLTTFLACFFLLYRMSSKLIRFYFLEFTKYQIFLFFLNHLMNILCFDVL